jgi:hypothetical protein
MIPYTSSRGVWRIRFASWLEEYPVREHDMTIYMYEERSNDEVSHSFCKIASTLTP